MRRWLLVTTIVAALFATSADALADVRQASLDDPRDTPQDVNGNYNHPDIQQVLVLYDTAGTVRVTVRLYDPVPQYGSALSLGLRSHVGSCSPSSTYDATVSMRLQRAPSNESITIQGLEGSIPLQQSVSDDGYEVTWEATHQALADRAYKCVTSGRVADGTSAADSTPEFLLVGPGAYRAEPFPAPACSADYEAAHEDFPFTLSNLPTKLAYGRKVEFDMSGPFFADLYPDWQTVEPSFLAIQHRDGKRPFLDDVTHVDDRTYTVAVTRSTGDATVTLSWLEGPDPTGRLDSGGNCRRFDPHSVAAVPGKPPRVRLSGNAKGTEISVLSGDDSLHEVCSLSQTGAVTLQVKTRRKVRKLHVSDACDGKWGRAIRTSEFTLKGDTNPDPFNYGEASLRCSKPGTYYLSAFFHGRRIAYKKLTLRPRQKSRRSTTPHSTTPRPPRHTASPPPSWLADGDPPFGASNYGGGWRPARAIDDDLRTAWTTGRTATGIVVDTGEAQPYNSIGIATTTPGFAVTVYSSSNNKGRGDPASNGWKRVGSASKVARYQTIRIPPANVRYLLIYVTRLPSGKSSAAINELRLLL